MKEAPQLHLSIRTGELENTRTCQVNQSLLNLKGYVWQECVGKGIWLGRELLYVAIPSLSLFVVLGFKLRALCTLGGHSPSATFVAPDTEN